VERKLLEEINIVIILVKQNMREKNILKGGKQD
jgi:hypothetical protein